MRWTKLAMSGVGLVSLSLASLASTPCLARVHCAQTRSLGYGLSRMGGVQLSSVTSATGNSNSISGSTGPITVTQTSGPVIVHDGESSGFPRSGGSGATNGGAGLVNVGGLTRGGALVNVGTTSGGGVVSVGTGSNFGELVNLDGRSGAGALVNLGNATGFGGRVSVGSGASGALLNVNTAASTGSGSALVNANLGSGSANGAHARLNPGAQVTGSPGLASVSPETSPSNSLTLCAACVGALTGGVGG